MGRRDLHAVLTPACATHALSGGEFLSQSSLWDSTHPTLPGSSPPSLCSPGPEPSKPGLTVDEGLHVKGTVTRLSPVSRGATTAQIPADDQTSGLLPNPTWVHMAGSLPGLHLYPRSLP